MKINFRRFSITISWIWLGIFVLIPGSLLLLTSLLQKGDVELIRLNFTLSNYTQALFSAMYFNIFLRSLWLGGITTIICLIIGFPLAYFIAQTPPLLRKILLLLMIIPFWTNSLITTYAIMIIIKARGLLNNFLLHAGIIHQPLLLLYTQFAVILGLVYNLLPFMVLPLYANLERFDRSLIEAAKDLGAGRWRVFSRITIPLHTPGIFAGCLFVLLPAMTMFYIPGLLGGAKSLLLGNLIEDQFISLRNWPLGASISVLFTLFMGILIAIYWRISGNTRRTELI